MIRALSNTGQGLALLHSARKPGVELNRADAIVRGPGHYDHAGGLSAALAPAPRARVCAHPEAFRRRFARRPDGATRDIWSVATIESCVAKGAPAACESPKCEIRSTKQIRNSKSQCCKEPRTGLFRISDFAHSGLFRISSFGFRALPARGPSIINACVNKIKFRLAEDDRHVAQETHTSNPRGGP